jgi:hypothetical protein
VSIPNRIYRIAKSYLNQARDRIEALDTELAEKELQGPADTPPPAGAPSGAPPRHDTSAEGMIRRAEDRIAAARREHAAREEMARSRPSASPGPAVPAAADAAAATADYRILGVPESADWPAVQSAYEKLARRCDPRRFPEGSSEQQDAQRILDRVNAAYESLRKRLDPTESRFGKLEF